VLLPAFAWTLCVAITRAARCPDPAHAQMGAAGTRTTRWTFLPEMTRFDARYRSRSAASTTGSNSFYRDTPHPFVLAMLNTLEVAQASSAELPIQAKLNRGRAKKVRADQDLMVATVRRIIEERRPQVGPAWKGPTTSSTGC